MNYELRVMSELAGCYEKIINLQIQNFHLWQ